MPQTKDRFIDVIDRLAKFVALAIVLVLPLGYASLAYRNHVFELETLAQAKAEKVTELISGNPGLWTYQVQRIEELMATYPAPIDDEAVRAYDANGALLAMMGKPPDAPRLRRAHPLHDSGRVVGKVEVEHSMRA